MGKYEMHGILLAWLSLQGAVCLEDTLLAVPSDPMPTHIVVYNRVNKAGSSTMLHLLGRLRTQNEFYLANDNSYHPGKTSLRNTLETLKNGSVYVNHCGFLAATSSNYIWINVVREPVSRMQSVFYYAVDSLHRGDAAVAMLQQRKEEGTCGCASLEFDACVRLRNATAECTIHVEEQFRYFCEPRDCIGPKCNEPSFLSESGCNASVAWRHVRDTYAMVGLTDEMRLVVVLLEDMFPRWFRGASLLVSRRTHGGEKKRKAAGYNSLTHTQRTGCVSDTALAILRETDNYRAEEEFYQRVKERFWRQISFRNLTT